MAGAMRQENCDTCRDHRGGPEPRCLRRWEHIACAQADAMREQAKRIQELIRARDHEKSQAEAAYDLAEQYARKLGVDMTRQDTLRYVEQYWVQRGKFERDWAALEDLRWDIFRLVRTIEDHLRKGPGGEPAPVDALTGRGMAEGVCRVLKSHPSLGGKSKRMTDLFARPAAPSAPVDILILEGTEP